MTYLNDKDVDLPIKGLFKVAALFMGTKKRVD